MSNADEQLQEVLYKATINETNLPNVILNRQQTDQFLDMVEDESVFVNQVRKVRRDHPSGQINRLNLSEPVTEDADLSATENTPTESTVNYDMKKLRATFDLKRDFMEDIRASSPEQARQRIARMFATRIGNDVEMLAFQGDDSITDTSSAENRLLQANDGWVQLLDDNIDSSNVIDAEGAAASKKLFWDVVAAVPNKYKKFRNRMRWVLPPSIWEKWVYDLTGRATNAGDSALTRQMSQVPGPFGIPAVEAGLMAEDESYGTIATDCCRILLTIPKNLIYFVQREITWEWERKPRTDMYEATVHMRTDYQVENEDAVAMAKDVSIGSSTDYSG